MWNLGYSKVSIIRPGRSRLLGFEKNSTGDFFKKFRPGRLIETVSKYINKPGLSIFSEMDLFV